MDLSPEILKMRDALLERIGDKPLKDVAQIVNEILLNETNSINRLAALSARVKVLRDYINQNYDIKKNSNKKNKLDKSKLNIETDIKDSELNNTNEIEETEDWVRVEMLKSGVVNGVRFPQGVIIDVSKTDATKLVEDNLSRIIEIEDNGNKEAPESKVEVDSKTEEANQPKADAKEVPESKVEVDSKTGETNQPKADAKEVPESKIEVDSKTEEANQPKADAKEVPESKVEVDSKTEETNQPKNDDLKVDTKIQKKLEVTGSENKDPETLAPNQKILKKKSTKITEETIELTDPKAVAEALGLNEKKKKEEEPKEIEEEIDIEALEIGKRK
jgi:hypothetical protein